MNALVFGQPHDPQHAASALDALSSSAGQPSPVSGSDYDIALPNGRRLAIAEFGTPHGVPVLYFHGFPASRLEAALAHPAAVEASVRLIAIDRPGCGRSDFLLSRTLAHWPHDVDSVANALDLRRFAILGISGGAPYALACAAAMPARVSAVGIVAGLGMTEFADDFARLELMARTSFRLARSTPWLSRAFNHALIGVLRRRPEVLFTLLAARLSPSDSATLADAEIVAILAASLREALRGGSRGASLELALYARPWNFDLATIRVPCYLWHGDQDRTVPIEMGRRLAALIPDCRATFLPDEGHFSLPVRHCVAVLRTLSRHA